MKKAILISLAFTALLLIVACEQESVTPQTTAPSIVETPAVVELVVVDEYKPLQTAQDSFNALDEALELYE
ncbi:MAG: hypothetical protein O2779_05485 [Nanoarchaeota archaeon]|nr:hypothetical protein [Nanoarchaeota archaeon]